MYDLFDYNNYSHKSVINHKNSIISYHAGFLKVENNLDNDTISSGILIKFNNLVADKEYKLSIEAILMEGDQAFVFVESDIKRLVPRTYIFHHNVLTQYEIRFKIDEQALSDNIKIGILFFNKGIKYVLHITEFTLV